MGKSTFVAMILASSFVSATAMAQSLNIDTTKSAVRWVGKKVSGQHNGTVGLKSGSVELDGGNIKGGEFEIDMAKIVVEDLKDAEYNKKLTDHLKSDDFFGVDKHQTAKFKITSVKPLKTKEATHEITGDLTIKGATHPVAFPALVKVNKDSASAKAKLKVDRTKYGVKYGSGKFFDNLGDKMINDDFEIELDLQAAK